MDMNTINTDVLISGAGAAGIRAAIAAGQKGVAVTIVTESRIGDTGSTFSEISKGWGIQALVGDERTDENLEIFYDEIINAGLGQCDPGLVQTLVEESGERLNDLISYGIRFKKDDHGDYLRVKGCFSDVKRALLTDDLENSKQAFMSILQRLPVKIVTGFVLDLILCEKVCRGAWIATNTGEITRIDAGATILATGGGAGIFKDHMVGSNDFGHGYALADRAGAELDNMEFIQFMLGLKHNGSRDFLSLGDPQKPVVMYDSRGGDLLERHIPDSSFRAEAIAKRLGHGPFSCRDTSCRIDLAVAQERKDGKKVYASNGKVARVVHFAHAFNGGIRINKRTETTIPGLYAAGEVAAGPHGADRIGGCMMTATQVFGKIAGESAAEHAKLTGKKAPPDVVPIGMGSRLRSATLHGDPEIFEIEKEVKGLMNRYVAVIRDRDGLGACLNQLAKYKRLWDDMQRNLTIPPKKFFKLRNMIHTARLVAQGALKRHQSCGSHFRSDFSATTVRKRLK